MCWKAMRKWNCHLSKRTVYFWGTVPFYLEFLSNQYGYHHHYERPFTELNWPLLLLSPLLLVISVFCCFWHQSEHQHDYRHPERLYHYSLHCYTIHIDVSGTKFFCVNWWAQPESNKHLRALLKINKKVTYFPKGWV